ncbi:MAG: hypothetical protein HKL84_00760 [Acidimicrobiaceae bacterium]|nr:hypothetical protein [Acidimicrobiaceae bacterium]
MGVETLKAEQSITQRRFTTAELLLEIYEGLPKPGIISLLADYGHELFPGYLFSDLYPSSLGRSTTPKRTLATVMVLGAFDGIRTVFGSIMSQDKGLHSSFFSKSDRQ